MTIEQQKLILSAVSTRSLLYHLLYDIVSGINKINYYTCEMMLQNIRTYRINIYRLCILCIRQLPNLKRFTDLRLRLNAAILLHVTMEDVREFHM